MHTIKKTGNFRIECQCCLYNVLPCFIVCKSLAHHLRYIQDCMTQYLEKSPSFAQMTCRPKKGMSLESIFTRLQNRQMSESKSPVISQAPMGVNHCTIIGINDAFIGLRRMVNFLCSRMGVVLKTVDALNQYSTDLHKSMT